MVQILSAKLMMNQEEILDVHLSPLSEPREQKVLSLLHVEDIEDKDLDIPPQVQQMKMKMDG